MHLGVYYSFYIPVLLLILYNASINPHKIECNSSKIIKYKNTIVIAFVIIGYITFWAAIRNGYADTDAYIASYKSLNSQQSFAELWNKGRNPLWSVWQLLFKKMGLNYHSFLGSVAVISGICIAYGLGMYSEDVVMSCFLFISFGTYIWMFNGIRQFLVAAVLFSCQKWFVDKKFIRLLILVFVLYFIHKSVLIIIPIYIVANFRPWSKEIVVSMVLIVVIVYLFRNQLVGLLSESTALGTDIYNFDGKDFENDDGVNILRVAVYAVTTVLAFFERKQLNMYNNKYLDLWVNMSLITTTIYFVGFFTSGILVGRLPLYTEMANLILLPFILKRTMNRRYSWIVKLICILCFIYYFYYQSMNYYYTTDLIPSLNLYSFS